MKPENAVTVLLTVWLIVFAVIACIPSDAAAFFGSIIWSLAVVIYALVSDYIEDIKEIYIKGLEFHYVKTIQDVISFIF